MEQRSYLQNLHTHTTYCDGKDTPEELVIAAIELGFDSLGFSEHGYNVHNLSSRPLLSPDKAVLYQQEIAGLKERYQDQIQLFCGVELEAQSPIDLSPYDYVIGSVHYLNVDGEILAMDRPADVVERLIREHFAGDGMRYVKAYYENQAKLLEYNEIDIVGHFDLLAKHCETHNMFDVESEEYLKYAFEAIEMLREKFHLFEINTGAIARGYRTTPYPSVSILKELKRKGCGIVINSDCHDKQYLDCYFREAEQLLRSCGFREKYVLRKEGFVAVPL